MKHTISKLVELYINDVESFGEELSDVEIETLRDFALYSLEANNGGETMMNENNNPGTITNNMNNTTTTPRADKMGFGFNTLLDTVTFTFTQETNCVDGPSNDIETLTIEAKSSLGIDGDGGAFYVLRTEQWSIDGSNEISELIKRCERAIDAIVK